MAVLAPEQTRAKSGEVEVELTDRGKGRPILFLHPGHPAGRVDPSARVIELLAQDARVIAPTHPGFGAGQAPRHLTTIDDLAYLYLDLMETLNLRNCVVVGA